MLSASKNSSVSLSSPPFSGAVNFRIFEAKNLIACSRMKSSPEGREGGGGDGEGEEEAEEDKRRK